MPAARTCPGPLIGPVQLAWGHVPVRRPVEPFPPVRPIANGGFGQRAARPPATRAGIGAVAVVLVVVHGPAGPHGGAGAPAEFVLRTSALGRHAWLPTYRRAVASAHSACLSRPPERMWTDTGLPAAAGPRRNLASMTPHETGSTATPDDPPRDGTATAHVRPPRADPGGPHRRLPPGLSGPAVPVPEHRPRPHRPSHRVLRPRTREPPRSPRYQIRQYQLDPARCRGGHRHHQPGDLGPPSDGHARRPLGLARHRTRLPRPPPRESAPPGLLRAPRIPRRPRPPARPVAGHPRPRLLLRVAQERDPRPHLGRNRRWPAASSGSRQGRSKTLVGRILPISPPIAEALARRRARRDPDSPLVFHRDGIPIRRWRTAWRTACQVAGVPTRFLHDCRRTAARNLIRASVPERVAMLLTGHKSRAIFDRYNIINEQELLEAGDQLVAYLAQQALAPGQPAHRITPPPRTTRHRVKARGHCSTPGTNSSSIWRSRRRRCQPRRRPHPASTAAPRTAPAPPHSCDAAPRKGARPPPAPARGRGTDTARLCATARAQATDTTRPAIVAHAAPGRADVAEHEHTQGPAAGACRKAGCHLPAQGHTRPRGVASRSPPAGIVRLISLDPKNLQSRTIRLQVDATRPERRLGLV